MITSVPSTQRLKLFSKRQAVHSWETLLGLIKASVLDKVRFTTLQFPLYVTLKEWEQRGTKIGPLRNTWCHLGAERFELVVYLFYCLFYFGK